MLSNKKSKITLIVSAIAVVCVLGAIQLVLAQTGPYTAHVYVDNQGVLQVKPVTWTMTATETVKYQLKVDQGGLTYTWYIHDDTDDRNIEGGQFTASSPQCNGSDLTTRLDGGHKYTANVDILAGQPPLTETPLARVIVKYLCQPN